MSGEAGCVGASCLADGDVNVLDVAWLQGVMLVWRVVRLVDQVV